MLGIQLIDSWASLPEEVDHKNTKTVGKEKSHGSLEALLRVVGKMLKMATMLECPAVAGGLLEKLTASWLPYLAFDRPRIKPLPTT